MDILFVFIDNPISATGMEIANAKIGPGKY